MASISAASSPATSSCPITPRPATGWWRRCSCWRWSSGWTSRSREVCHCFEPLPQILKNVRYKQGQPLEGEARRQSAIEAARQLLGEGGRLVIRPSGTEPVIRVMAEGDDRDLVMRAVDDVVDAVTKAAA